METAECIPLERLVRIFNRDHELATGCECDSCELIRMAGELLARRGVTPDQLDQYA